MTNRSGQLWGGRFTKSPNDVFAEFNRSFGFDQRLWVADISASIAHANGLLGANVLTSEESDAIISGLKRLLEEETLDPNYFDNSDAEDIHSFIEGRLIDAIGDLGRKLHTGRSRNDQVATAFRLWVRYEIDSLDNLLKGLQTALIAATERHREAILPGYTHLQRAQPVMWAHWCLAYFEMLRRDRERLVDARKRANILPLGSGALAGSGFPIDRQAVASELGFDTVSANSLDAVSDRDFAVELAGACSLIMIHLSRLSEDLIIYCSAEFGFVTLADSVSTGSSLMPQKKNPDALELLRGKTGRVIGDQIALLTMLKGLPLAYNKDMQEDKVAVFDAVDTTAISLRVAAVVLDAVTLDEEKTLEAATKGYLNATELADYLVRKGVPFRQAHDTVGKVVLFAIDKGQEMDQMNIDDLRKFSDAIGEDVFESLTLEATIDSKSAIGGTSRQRVGEALAAAIQYLQA